MYILLKRMTFFVLVVSIVDVSFASVKYHQSAGQYGVVSMEAENFSSKTSAADHTWQFSTSLKGYLGKGLMTAGPDDDSTSDIGEGPSLNFDIDFVKTGSHYLWVRSYGIESGDSCHAALDGQGFAEKIEMKRGHWSWVNETDDGGPAEFQIRKTGLHTVSIQMREDGASVDRLLITTNPDYKPERFGPAGLFSGGELAFVGSGSSGLETKTQVELPVALTAWQDKTFSVDYSVAGGTADSRDYQLKPGTLTFEPGQKLKNIKLTITDDGIDEPDETVIVKLSNPKGEEARLGFDSTFTYTILDPRPVVEFATTSSGVTEQDGFVTVPLKLSVAYGKPVTVNFVAAGPTASADDYALEGNTVTFKPGQLESSIKVAIKDDGIDEPTETFNLKLTKARNAALRGRNEHTVSICTKSYSRLGGAYYFRYNSGQRWEKYAKVGKYPDAMVTIGDGDDRLVFWRGASYLPFLDTADGKSFLDVVVPQNGDGPGLMFDRTNRHSHIRIVESSPARVIVEWRYVPDFDKKELEWWTEEYFTIYPDGVCYRSVNTGTQTLQEYQDTSHAQVHHLLLTDKGIYSMPRSWVKPIEFEIDKSSLENFNDLGYDRTRRHYALDAKSGGAPDTIRFKVDSDVSNPAIFVKRWGDAGVNISVDGRSFENFKVGYANKMNNNDLILWFDKDFKTGSRVVIEPVGGSAPVVRAPVPNPYKSEIADFPKGSSDPGPFGAYYTTLKYWKLWDKPWRVGDYADVVVQFDQSPDRLIFWRGTTNVPHWSNEKNHWYENEFCERRGGDSGLDGLCEPMQDHDSKFSNVMILHSTPARAVVHWRYSPVTLSGNIPFVDETGWGDCVDEYHYVYPDESCVRDTTLYTSVPNKFHEWHEAIPLVNPGMIPEDCLDMQALSMANASGDEKVFNFEKGFPPNSELEDGYNIILIGLKGKGKPYAICESAGQWFDPISRPGDTRFNHYDDWPAWPKKYRRNDWEDDPENNYRLFWKFLPSHSSMMHLNWDNYESSYDGPVVYLRRILLNGMTGTNDVKALVPLARYWENPPLIKVTGYGFSGASFDKSQKAYKIDRRITWNDELVNRDDDEMPNKDADKVDLQVFASNESPLINPCFIINNWPRNAKARLYINGKQMAEGKNFRQGIETNWAQWQPTSSLVIWVRSKSRQKANFTIEMVK